MFWPLTPAGSFNGQVATMLAGLLPLAAIVYGAVRAGLRESRIPNTLVLAGAATGLLLNSVLPDGNGFLAPDPGGVGPWQSMLGILVGALAMAPFYRLGGIGAGSVKLMAAIGAILGPADVVPAVLGTLLAGAGVGLAVTLRRGAASGLLAAVAARAQRLFPGAVGMAAPAGAEAPYVLAVALGTVGGVAWVLLAPRFG